ncbi:MAG: hypothetical protein E7571_02285 [Ruminococcaceae bacterium]|nr:hypothetical protein [Oscillospiraceae bacterium]
MKQFKILTVASAVFVICIVIAYHNTASFGYDKHHVIYYDKDSIEIMDYNIEYKEIKKKIDKIENFLPDSFVTI